MPSVDIIVINTRSLVNDDKYYKITGNNMGGKIKKIGSVLEKPDGTYAVSYKSDENGTDSKRMISKEFASYNEAMSFISKNKIILKKPNFLINYEK